MRHSNFRLSSKLVLVPLAGALVLGGVAGCQKATSAQASPAVVTTTSASTPTGSTAAPDVASLVAKVKPSVVNITAEHVVKAPDRAGGDGSPFDFFFQGPGRVPNMGPQAGKQRALGSGFIVDPRGYVVTNAHVVEGADNVRVKLADEREFKAKVKGRDRRLDLAVLELEGAKNLPAVTLGSSDVLKVGEYVVAIGNPFGLGQTVTMGIVSAKGRAIGAGPYDDFIQTDASINPGNSGGPLFDAEGRVVGINTAINPAGQGIGFAIPSDALRDVLPQLIASGHVERGRLGVMIQSVDETLAKAMSLPSTHGALAAEVEKGSPAERSGIQSGDIIIGVDGTAVAHAQDLPRMVARHAPGSKVELKVMRAGSERTIPVTLGALKDDEPEASSTPHESATNPSGLGIGVENTDEGVRVTRVMPGSLVAGKLLPGDTIVELNRSPVRTASDLVSKIQKAGTDKPLLLQVKRDGSTHYVAIARN